MAQTLGCPHCGGTYVRRANFPGDGTNFFCEVCQLWFAGRAVTSDTGSLRDSFAMAALTGLLGNANVNAHQTREDLIRACYVYADIALSVRKEAK